MGVNKMKRRRLILIIGDSLVILIVAVIGFASHGTLDSPGSRLLATLIPFLAAWFATAIPLQALDPQATQGVGLWRPGWAVVLAAPLGSWVRGLWLQTPVLTTFVLVMVAFLLLGLLLWRLFYNFVIFPRLNDSHG